MAEEQDRPIHEAGISAGGNQTEMADGADEEMVAGDWKVTITDREYDKLKLELANATSRADAAEKEIARIIGIMTDQETRIATAWRERDEANKLRADTERVLKSAVTLLAYFGSKA